MDQHVRVDFTQLLSAAQPLLAAFPGDIWLAHEIVERPNGKLDKPPAPGFRSNDPVTWCSLGLAVATAERYPPGDAGVGFIVVDGMITFDFDGCIASDGTVVPEVAALIDRLDSFSYTTVSSTGMRVVCRNDAADPIAAGKYAGRTANRYKVEVFVGPTNHYNTFSAATNGKTIAARGGVVRELLEELTSRTGAGRARGGDSNVGELGRTSDLGKKARNVDALLAALAVILHNEAIDRDLWVKIAGAVYAGTEGSEQGRAAFVRWSKTWHRHDEAPEEHTEAAEKLWNSFSTSPPRAVGAGTVFKMAKRHGWRWPPPEPAKPADSDGFTSIAFVDVQVTAMRDFVEDLLETDTVVVVFGPPGSGKTFWVLDLLLHVAWGRPWFGRMVESGPALLFELEGRRGVERRIAAFRQHHRLQGVDLPFRVISGQVDLGDDASVDDVIKRIKREGRELGARVKIVAIDTLAAALGSHGDENNPEVMNPVLANCHRIREQTRGCCLILVHHPGKAAARGPRGFSGIGATVSTLIEIEYPEKGKPRRVVVRKQRDLELPETDMFYKLKVVELGVDRRGKVVTSCVVVPILDPAALSAAEVQTRLAQLTKQHRLAYDALREALERHGLKPADGKPAARVTSDRVWRAVFRERFPAETAQEATKKALQRARQALLAAQLIGVAGNQVWLREEAG